MNGFQRLGLRTKVLLSVGLACLICGGVSLSVAVYYNGVEFRRGLVEKSRTIHGRLDVAAKYVATQGGLKPMIDRYTQKYKSSSELTDQDKAIIIQQVPIYAAMRIGAEGAEQENYGFRVFSNEPRKKENAASPAEMEIFNKFEKDPTLKEYVADDGKVVTVYRPIHLRESHGCLTCHGEPATSPWNNGYDILGYKMENWKDGKLHGVFAISNDIATVVQAQNRNGGTSSTTYLAIFIIAGGILALFLAAIVVRGPVNALRAVAAALSESGNQVGAASQEIVSSSQELSQAATEQASSLQETAASIEEMSAMVTRNTENSKRTASTSTDSQSKADEGKGAVARMAQSMEEIDRSNGEIMVQIEQSNHQMEEVVKVIRGIGEKTKVINDIVFQTKLLSFNASVEAARAGEHGKGFAVVAEEVGNLAQMSGNAAKEISEMLEGSVNQVESMVHETKTKVETLIQQGKIKVESGIKVARQCGELLTEIVTNVSDVSRMAEEIASASQEQSQGIGEINKAMAQLDQVTQQNATTSVEVSDSAEKLSAQAETMRGAVRQLVGTLDGESSVQKHASLPTDRPGSRSRPRQTGSAKVLTFPSTDTKSFRGTSSSLRSAVGDGTVPDQSDAGFEDV
jgi:methyl-accepting chemotaxis protein